MCRLLPVLFLAILFWSFAFSSKKIITDKEFRHEFFTTDKKVFAKEDRMYFWFKGGTIHSSENGTAGELLHDTYVKFYLNNQLAEKGTFNNGLKTGIWNQWHPDGKLHEKIYWQQGQKNGTFYSYDKDGEITQRGYFRKDQKHGNWINYITKDTILYKRGAVIPKPQKTKRIFWKKRTPEEKLADSIKRAERKTKRVNRREEKRARVESPMKTQKENKDSKNFLQRVFSSKSKNRDKSK